MSLLTKAERETRFRAYTARTDPWLGALALVFLVVLTLGVGIEVIPSPWWEIILVVQMAIWLVFFADIVVRVSLSPARLRWLITHPIDVLSVLLPAFRPLKVLTVIGNETLRGGRRGLVKTGKAVIVSAGLLVWVCALAVLPFERGAEDPTIRTFGDATWWALVTVTGVGYGDLTPLTPGGRSVAVILMFVGLSLVGVITAAVAAWFVSITKGADGALAVGGEQELRARLMVMEAKIDELIATQTAEPPPHKRDAP